MPDSGLNFSEELFGVVIHSLPPPSFCLALPESKTEYQYFCFVFDCCFPLQNLDPLGFSGRGELDSRQKVLCNQPSRHILGTESLMSFKLMLHLVAVEDYAS